MRSLFSRCRTAAWCSVAVFVLASCVSTESVVSPRRTDRPLRSASLVGGVVISQVYGGGGNAGSIYKNDYIELYNAGATDVSLSGWSVQYASSAGTTWQSTVLSGTIAAGRYYLVQEAIGSGGTTNLPTPEAVGTLALSATAGKVALVNNSAALTGACPDVATYVDFVGFGTAATCAEGMHPTPTLSNTTAALRLNGGATDSNDNAADFVVGAPNPRNGTVGGPVAGPVASVTVSPLTTSVSPGLTTAFNATAKDANGLVASTTFTWSSSDVSVATVNASTGAATGVTVGTATITATSENNVAGTATLSVAIAATIVSVGVTPNAASVATGGTTTLVATAKDANNAVVNTSFTWSSSNTTLATVDQTGKVTGAAIGGPVTITATTPNAVTGASQITVVGVLINSITLSSSTSSFPPGFQTQLFPTAKSGATTVMATFTFRSIDPSIATAAVVENSGIVTGVSGSATRPRFEVTATPVGGGATYTDTLTPITVEIPVTAPLGTYGSNDEFGRPTAAGISTTDFLISRPQYMLSYNQTRGTPNWVSYELDARHMVSGQDRCNCFSADPSLPIAAQILTSDYTTGGFDRGHMTRSFDRTVANVDNANTFYLTNVVPQMADLNQGVWASFENALGDSARLGGRAVYIITGPLYAAGATPRWLRNLNKVQIPDSTWKVAFIGPYTPGNPFTRANINSWADLSNTTVLAVNMPNIAGIRNDPWQNYLTTVDKIEGSTGYDLLSRLQDSYQTAVEAGDRPPVASFTGATTGVEGSAVTFNGSASTDPDLLVSGFGETLTYAWDFGDGTVASEVSPTKTFADNGTYSVTLTVTDKFGWPKSVSRSIVISNVAPIALLLARTATTVAVGQSVTFGASGTDAGTKDAPWTFTYEWADGTTYAGVMNALPAKTRPLLRAKSWSTPGTYVVTLSIRDKDGSIGSSSVTITVTP